MRNKGGIQCAVNSAQCTVNSAQCAVNSAQSAIRYWIHCVLVTAFCALISSCAQIVTPDGGPKDKTPPRIVRYSPDSAATNFHGTKIVITFDEYIALSDLNKQLIISPGVKRKPEVTVRKKDLIIQFKDTLEPNTTYSISFGKAIHDITENNVLNNFRFVFSTGPQIDSLKVSGRVVDAQTQRGEKNVLVMLYHNTYDSVPYKEKPYYYTRTDDDGNFLLTNLAGANYRIFALTDEGEDYLYNSTNESIAFSDTLVIVADDVDSLHLRMFKPKLTTQKLLNSQQLSPGRLQLAYNLSVDNPSVIFVPALPATMDPFMEWNERHDTLNIWLTKVETDSVQLVVKSGNVVLDSIPMRLDKPGVKKSGRAGTTDNRSLRIQNNAASGKLYPGNVFTLTANNPIRTIDTSKIVFLQGRDTLDPHAAISASQMQISFNTFFAEDSSYSVYIPKGAITDWFGQKNDTIRTNFTVQASRQFGNLSVKLPTLSTGNYILEVVDDKDHVLRDTIIHGASICTFNALAGGTYRLRLTFDTNGDGMWTTGNYPMHLQPERVMYYATTVRVRAGWDMDIDWRIGGQ